VVLVQAMDMEDQMEDSMEGAVEIIRTNLVVLMAIVEVDLMEDSMEVLQVDLMSMVQAIAMEDQMVDLMKEVVLTIGKPLLQITSPRSAVRLNLEESRREKQTNN